MPIQVQYLRLMADNQDQTMELLCNGSSALNDVIAVNQCDNADTRKKTTRNYIIMII